MNIEQLEACEAASLAYGLCEKLNQIDGAYANENRERGQLGPYGLAHASARLILGIAFNDEISGSIDERVIDTGAFEPSDIEMYAKEALENFALRKIEESKEK